MMVLLSSAAAVAGIVALWRNFRYDTDNPANIYLDRLPYLLQKPITCGLCVTFWIALIFESIFAVPNALPPTHAFIPDTWTAVAGFIASWMVLGTVSAFILYMLDTFFEVSHFYKHRAHQK